jgi:hypothetical protein
LHALRVLAGLLFLSWLLPFAGHVEALFSLQGWFDAEAYRQASVLTEEMPMPIGWSLLYLAGDATVLQVLYWGAIAVFLLFTLGVATRVTAVLSWVLILSFLANPATRSEADYLLGILAFYLMIGYVLLGQWSGQLSLVERILGSWDSFLLGARTAPQSYAANLAIRLLQVHFALIVFTSGMHKLQFGAWWSGVAFWYPLHPPYSTTEAELIALAGRRDSYLFLLSLAQYLVLAWQIGFPLFAWRGGRWRWLLLAGAVVGWVGSFWLYQQPLVGPVYAIGCLSFLTAAEWQRLWTRIRGRTPEVQT